MEYKMLDFKMFENSARKQVENNPNRKREKVDITQLRRIILNLENHNADLNYLDTSGITTMYKLFDGSFFNGNISEWDVSNVTNMQSMFEYSQFNGDISKWNVSKVENMSSMFHRSFFTGDISNWDVSKVENMCTMFSDSSFDGDISKWDVSNVRYMTQMFCGSKFTGKISIGNWDISNFIEYNFSRKPSGILASLFNDSKFRGDVTKWITKWKFPPEDVIKWGNGLKIKSEWFVKYKYDHRGLIHSEKFGV